MISVELIDELYRRLDDDLSVMRTTEDGKLTWAPTEEGDIQDALAIMKSLHATLMKIASMAHTKDLLWWQIEARTALGLPVEADGNE
jgi:hypothetical protein